MQSAKESSGTACSGPAREFVIELRPDPNQEIGSEIVGEVVEVTSSDCLPDEDDLPAKTPSSSTNRAGSTKKLDLLVDALRSWVATRRRDVDDEELLSMANFFAKIIGSSFVPTMDWIARFKQLFKHKEQRGNHNDLAGLCVVDEPLPCDTYQNPCPLTLKTTVAAWYDEASLKQFILPGEFQAMAVAFATNMRLTVNPSKSWLKAFTDFHGVYLPTKAAKTLILNADYGILKLLYEAAFEAWYFGWNFDLDDVAVEGLRMNENELHFVRSYLTSLTQRYMLESQTKDFTADEIKSLETEVIINLNAPDIVPNLILWSERWQMKISTWIENITYLNILMKEWYESSNKGVDAREFVEETERVAAGLGMVDFSISQQWARRFFELHGLRILVNRKVRTYGGALSQNVPISSLVKFRAAFNDWYALKDEPPEMDEEVLCGLPEASIIFSTEHAGKRKIPTNALPEKKVCGPERN